MEKPSTSLNSHTDRLDLDEKAGSLQSTNNVEAVDDIDAVRDAMAHLPWTAWATIISCTFWYASVSCTQLTLLFWSSAIIKTVGGGPQKLWLGQAFQVVTAVLGPVMAGLGDSIGRKFWVLLGLAAGAVGCILIATANNVNACVAGSAIFGLAYGSCGNVFSIPSETVPRRHRGTAQSIIFLGGVFGTALGTFVPASLLTNQVGTVAGWRSAMWFNFAFLSLTFIMFAVSYHPVSPPNPHKLSIAQRLMKVDFVGAMILAVGVVPLMMGLIWGGVLHPWKSGTIIALLVVGIAGFFGLAAHQLWIKKDGLFNHELFTKRNFAIAVASISIEGLVYNVFTSFYGEVTAILFDGRPIFLATRFSAFLWGALFICPFYAVYSYKRRDPKSVLIVGYAFFLIAFIGMATVQPGSGKIVILWAVIAGMGFCSPLLYLNVIVQLAVKPEFMGLATALTISSRSIGGTVGIAICNAVFNAKIETKLPAYIAKAVIGAGLPPSSAVQVVTGLATSDLTMAESAPGVTAAILEAGGSAALHAFADSLRFVWITAIPLVFVSFLCILTVQSSKADMNALIDRPELAFGKHEEA